MKNHLLPRILVISTVYFFSTFSFNFCLAECVDCHSEITQMSNSTKHAGLICTTCHTDNNGHAIDQNIKPETSLELSTCGNCHKNQYNSFFKVNYDAQARMEKGVPTGRSPMQDKLLAPHGFIKEHNEPRAHPFMVVDQFVVDRFARGRYQFKDMFGYTRPGKAWDVLVDNGPDRLYPPDVSAATGNPVCLQCKTSDLILKWKHMGDKDEKAKWDRTSDVNALIKDVQNPVGCIQCHDPHAAKPRIVRDALIDAVERDGARPYDPDKGQGLVNIVAFRNNYRKIGLLAPTTNGKVNSTLMCGQCHVEYNCNGGFEPVSGDKVTMADRRANHFPMKSALDLLAHYDNLKFRDFKHAVTGANLVKLQHPEMETYWGSVHDTAGVTCADCHMPKVTISGKGKQVTSYTSHQMLRPKDNVATVCIDCHSSDSSEDKLYQINAIQNYTKGKMRETEAAIGKLIDTYAKAKEVGVAEEVLAQARKQHEIAHVLWDWWAAENSDGWHNPKLAKDSLFLAIVEANKGSQLLTAAMNPPALLTSEVDTLEGTTVNSAKRVLTVVKTINTTSNDTSPVNNIEDLAYNAFGTRTYPDINQLLIQRSKIVPPPPVLSIATNQQRVALAWKAVPGATGYVLSYTPFPNTGTGNVTWIDLGDETSYSMDFWEGASYAVAVTAYNNIGESNFSNIVSFVIEKN